MSDTKLYTVVGVSAINGVLKPRFANDLKSRTTILTRNGHTDIYLVETPSPMTKTQAIEYAQSLPELQNETVLTALVGRANALATKSRRAEGSATLKTGKAKTSTSTAKTVVAKNKTVAKTKTKAVAKKAVAKK